jgi:hypothetical protein
MANPLAAFIVLEAEPGPDQSYCAAVLPCYAGNQVRVALCLLLAHPCRTPQLGGRGNLLPGVPRSEAREAQT